MAISKNKIVHYETYSGNINGDRFYKFMCTLNESYSGYYFLMDNVAFHKTQQIVQLAATKTTRFYLSLLILPNIIRLKRFSHNLNGLLRI